jgi:hypothetical protein
VAHESDQSQLNRPSKDSKVAGKKEGLADRDVLFVSFTRLSTQTRWNFFGLPRKREKEKEERVERESRCSKEEES